VSAGPVPSVRSSSQTPDVLEVGDGPDVVDGAMVSCRGWPDLPLWSRAFLQVLEK